MKTFEVASSHGSLIVSQETGEIVERLLSYHFDEDGKNYLRDITRFDVTEYFETFEELPEGSIDILHIGFWTDDTYHSPEIHI